MTRTPEPRWWRRHRDLALDDARSAAAAAAAALVRLDGDQRSAASHLAFVTGADDSGTAARLRTQWAAVSAAADVAIAAYLEASSQWDVAEDLPLESASAAAPAFRARAQEMERAIAGIEHWAQSSADDFVRLNKTLAQITERRGATEVVLADTHAALMAVEAQGWFAPGPRALLAQALDRFRVVEAGTGRHGIAGVLRACEDVVALADQAGTALRSLPELKTRVERRTLSLQTRHSALAWRVEQGDDEVLRTLRREFVRACSQDLDDGAARARSALGRASASLDQAAAAAAPQAQRWDDALDRLERARQALDETKDQVEEPHRRLALLRSVATDPRGASAAARFAVRDARQLLMAGPIEPRHGRTLDGLAARLEGVDALLDRPHPDWLTYAHTLDAIVDAGHGLVVEIRASRAR